MRCADFVYNRKALTGFNAHSRLGFFQRSRFDGDGDFCHRSLLRCG
jgi:hypothetical protein